MNNTNSTNNQVLETSNGVTTEKSTKSICEDLKKRLIHFADRRQHTVAQNLRLAGIAALIIFLIGIFQPLLGLSFGVGLENSNDNNSTTSQVNKQLFSTGSQFAQINLGDMAMQKPLCDYNIFGNKIDEIQILGLNLYDFAKAPFPDFSVLKKADAALDSETIQFLKSDKFVTLCQNYIGDYADDVIKIANTLVNLTENAGDVLDNIINVFNNLSTAKASLNNAVIAAENAVSTANSIVLVLVLIMIAAIVIFIIGKGPRYLSPIMLTPFTVIFLVIGIGFLVGNSIIANCIEPWQQAFNDGIKDYLLTSMPQLYQTVDNIAHLSNMNLVVTFTILAGAGWWLITLSLCYVNVTGYVLAKRNPSSQSE